MLVVSEEEGVSPEPIVVDTLKIESLVLGRQYLRSNLCGLCLPFLKLDCITSESEMGVDNNFSNLSAQKIKN